MTKLWELVKIVVAAAAVFALVCLGMAALAVRTVTRHADGVLVRAEAIESKVYATAGNLDAATKTWADASRAEAQTMDAIAGQMGSTLRSAQAALAEVPGTLGTVDAQMERLGPLADSLKATSDALPPMIATESGLLSGDLRTLSATLGDADALLRGPELAGVLSGAARTSDNLGGVTEDFRARFHDVLYPPPCRTVGCRVARMWPYLRDATNFTQSLYWTGKLLNWPIAGN